MKKILVYCFLITLISCGSLKNELWFNSDGSGKYKMHFDLGEVLKEMKSAFKDMSSNLPPMDSVQIQMDSVYTENDMVPTELPEDYEEYIDTTTYTDTYDVEESYESEYVDTFNYVHEAPKPDPIKEKMNAFFEGIESRKHKIDTTVSFYEILSGADSTADHNIEMLKNCLLTLHVDSVKEEMWFDFLFTYKNEKQLNSMLDEFDKISNSSNDFGGPKKSTSFYHSHDLKKKAIVSKEYNLFEGGTLQPEDKLMFEDMEETDLNNFLEMLGLQTLETTIHLPGKLKEVKGIAYSVVDEKTIVVKQEYIKFIKSGIVPGYEIYYK